MSDKLDIEKLFQDKFENFESDVSPDVWANVSQNIGASTGAAGVAAKTGMSVWVKTAIISGSIIAASVAGVYIFSDEEKSIKDKGQQKEIAQIDQPKEENKEPLIEVVSESDMDTAIDNNKKEIEEELNELKDEVKEYDSQVSERIVIKMDEIKDEPLTNLDELIDEVEVELSQNEESSASKENSTNNNTAEKEEKTSTDKETVKEEDSNTESENITEEDNTDFTSESNREEQKINIEIANVFTPNNDGVNDEWGVKAKNVSSFVIQIRNKSGEIVFESDNEDFKWDGRNLLGERVEKGPYFYTLVAEGIDGKSMVRKGALSVRY